MGRPKLLTDAATITLSLSQHQKDQLNVEAGKQGVSVSTLVRWILKLHFIGQKAVR